MISAFGVDHGSISKDLGGEYGFTSSAGRKRTITATRQGSRMSAGHGNAQRMGAHTAVGTGVMGGLGAALGAAHGFGAKGAAIGAGVGAGLGALSGAAGAKTENLQRSAAREVPKAQKRGDVRRLKSGERATAFNNIIRQS